MEISVSCLHQILAGLAVAAAVVTMSYWPHPDPWSYFNGAAQIYAVNVPANSYQYPFYLLGRIYDHPLKLYYIFTFLMKTPVPILFAIGGGILFWKRNSCAPGGTGAACRARHLYFILLPAGWMFLASAFDAYNVCNRRILPVYPFLILAASASAGFATRSRVSASGAPSEARAGGSDAGRIKQIIFAAACVWLILGAVRTYPDHLSYFNEAAGGPANGIYCLDECNVDWGQNLPRLATYLNRNAIPEVRMAAEDAGGDRRAQFYGIRYQPISPDEYISPKLAVYALSAHRVVWLKKQSIRLNDSRWNWMGRFRPSGTIGYSIYIYDFRK